MTTPTEPEATTDAPDLGPPPQADASAEEIEADIARTREQLGHTVEELSGKLDVKSRAKDKLHDGLDRVAEQGTALRDRGRHYADGAVDAVSDDYGKPKPTVSAAGAALVAMGVAFLVSEIWRRSR